MIKIISFILLILVSCKGSNTKLNDISFSEVKEINLKYLDYTSAFLRTKDLVVIRIHDSDSCESYSQLLITEKLGAVNFKVGTTWHKIEELCNYYDCKNGNISFDKVMSLYKILMNKRIEISWRTNPNRIYFNGTNNTFIYYPGGDAPFDSSWKKIETNWWLSQ